MSQNRKYADTVTEGSQNMAGSGKAPVLMTALVTELIPELCGVPYDYLLRDDPVAMAECTLLVQEYLDLDLIIANLDIYNFEAEAMGAELKFYPDHCSDIVRSNYFIKDRKDPVSYTHLSYARMSVQKACYVLDVIRGKDVETALGILTYNPRYASSVIKKLLESAVANAENNNGMSRDNLYVAECFANKAPTMKRIQPRAQGRAYRIEKRTSHISIVLDER